MGYSVLENKSVEWSLVLLSLGRKPRWKVYGRFFIFSGVEEAALVEGRWEDPWEDSGRMVISDLSVLSRVDPVILIGLFI